MKTLTTTILWWVCIFIIVMTTGCFGPNIRQNISMFDGTKSISLTDNCQSLMCTERFFDTKIRLGLFKNSKMLKDDLILTVTIPMIKSLGSLYINVDGEQMRFEPIDRVTEFSKYGSFSSKRYQISVTILKRMILSKRTHIKVILNNRTYILGSFDKVGWLDECNVRIAFTEFYEQLKIFYQ